MVETNGYRELPVEAEQLLAQVSAPPRLVAHLVLVHDAACELIEKIRAAFPGLTLNEELVRFGAATHDIGKAVVISELSESGHKHQERGRELMKSLGVPEERARFAFTHGNWDEPGNDSLEDLLVALADKCWRAKLNEQLESAITERLSLMTGDEAWKCYSRLDDIVTSFAHDAEAKLAWQRNFPVS